jgi:hypothetical protein
MYEVSSNYIRSSVSGLRKGKISRASIDASMAKVYLPVLDSEKIDCK